MKPSVLIVDDHEDNRFVLIDALEDEDYTIRESVDGKDALASIELDPPDVILLDIMMPGMNGIECCRYLKANPRTSDIPVILVTALSADQNVIDGLNAGATDYVAKPFAGPVVRARVRAALRSKQAHDQLEQQNIQIGDLAKELKRKNVKLATLTETAHRFVDNVAHEFRTPLAVVKEFSSIISDGLGGPVTDSQQEYLRYIEHATRDLAQMVDDFLDSSKLKARTLRVDRQPRDIASIFESVRPLLEVRAALKDITIECEISENLQQVFADDEKVARVIINLAINAIKFSPDRSTVRLWARPGAKGGAEIGVTDQGPGLSPEDIRTVFQRFKQVGNIERSSTKGFGLGLNIAKELIWLNLGTVEVSSTLGSGSTFSFSLPPCDPRIILDWYFERLSELNERPIALSVLQPRMPNSPTAVRNLHTFLVSSCYPTDLVLTSSDGRNLLLVGPTIEPSSWVDRLEQIHKPDAALADSPVDQSMLSLACLGSWQFAQADRLLSLVIDRLGGHKACA